MIQLPGLKLYFDLTKKLNSTLLMGFYLSLNFQQLQIDEAEFEEVTTQLQVLTSSDDATSMDTVGTVLEFFEKVKDKIEEVQNINNRKFKFYFI